MGNKQVYFGLAVGLLVASFGSAVTLISSAGFGLLAAGVGLMCLSLVLKVMNVNTQNTAKAAALAKCSSNRLEQAANTRKEGH